MDHKAPNGPEPTPPPEAPGHQWWAVSNRGEHGRHCTGCRRAPGGPDATEPRRT